MEKDNFFVFDIKTANNNFSSLCEIALVGIEKYKMHSFWRTIINAEQEFIKNSPLFARINYDSVKYAPKPKEALDIFYKLVENEPLVSFSGHEFNILNYNNDLFYKDTKHNPQIIANGKIATILENLTNADGLTIESLAKKHNLIYHPNFAIDDARVTAYLVLFALKESKTKINQWIIN